MRMIYGLLAAVVAAAYSPCTLAGTITIGDVAPPTVAPSPVIPSPVIPAELSLVVGTPIQITNPWAGDALQAAHPVAPQRQPLSEAVGDSLIEYHFPPRAWNAIDIGDGVQ